jgi:hypothetical protein
MLSTTLARSSINSFIPQHLSYGSDRQQSRTLRARLIRRKNRCILKPDTIKGYYLTAVPGNSLDLYSYKGEVFFASFMKITTDLQMIYRAYLWMDCNRVR